MSIARKVMESPGRYSIQQLRQAMERGILPAYIAVPLIQEKTQLQKQFQQQQMMRQPPVKQMPPIAQQVMQEAQGVEQLPTNLPQEYAAGGIVAFDEGGEVERYRDGGDLTETQKKMRRLFGLPETLETPAAPQWNPFTNSYEPLTEAQKEQLAAGERAQRESYQAPRTERVAEMPSGMASEIGIPGFAGYEAPESTPRPPATPTAPAAAPAAKPPGAPPAAGPAGIQGIFAQLPEYKPSKTTEQRFSEFAPGFREAIQGIETRRKEETEKLRGQITGQAYEGLEKQLQKEAEESGMDKDQAKNMAIFKAGLAMMAGTSRNALQNIGAGAMVGAEDYQKAAAEIKKAQKENQRMMAHIEQARRAEKRGDVDRQMEELNKASDRELKVEEFLSKGMFEAGIKDEDAQREMFKNRLTVAGQLGVAQTQAGARTQGRGEMTAANRLAAMKLLENKEPVIHQKAIAMLGFKPDMKNPKHVVAYNEAKDKVTKEELNNILRTIGGESFGASEVPTTDLGSQGYKVIRNP